MKKKLSSKEIKAQNVMRLPKREMLDKISILSCRNCFRASGKGSLF
jgi:hypothetical protein